MLNETINLKPFAVNLRRRRKEQGLSQSKLADLLGEKRATLAAWEEGRSQPSLEKLIRIVDELHIDDIKSFISISY